ncbi:MAG: hypothetical protein ACRDO2_08420 [Nocardioidaceae bacterium]
MSANEFQEVAFVDSEHNKYDTPEPQEDTRSRGAIFVLGAIVVLGLLYLIATGEVPWR